ncbi:hypothetical protein QBC44DRAFT_361980 [Cladorrhinum sp. PSN332]|nr:hypothetical protein QBC44DRAFT_361980 [Cladorrhinum sp. PSN332]
MHTPPPGNFFRTAFASAIVIENYVYIDGGEYSQAECHDLTKTPSFIYGGFSKPTSSASDKVYVLSLPGFVFFKAAVPSTPRISHACVLAGRRQMLSIGGTDALSDGYHNILDPYPWLQGLGIFDLSSLNWSSSYDANADEYESPEVVNQWYSREGLRSVAWSSLEVKGLFVEEASDPNQSTSLDQDSVSAEAIVGAILGGVVFLILLGYTGCWIARRKKKNRSAFRIPLRMVKELNTTADLQEWCIVHVLLCQRRWMEGLLERRCQGFVNRWRCWRSMARQNCPKRRYPQRDAPD